MKRIAAFFILLGFVQLACNALFPTATPAPAPADDPFATPWDAREIYEEGLVPSSRAVLAELPDASVYHLQFELESDMLHLNGSEEVRYTNAEDVPLEQVRFRLFPNLLGGEMHVPEVRVDGKPIVPNYSMNDSLLTVPLAAPLEPGQSVTLAMDFTLTVPDTVELNYGVLAYAEGVLALAHAYPMIAVYNEEGWNAEVPPQSGDVTFADMSFFIVKVTAPKDLTLVAVGREIARTESGSTQTVTYAAGPVRDFYLAASDDYELITKQAGETTVRFYAPRSVQSGARFGLDSAVLSVEDFSQRYAVFPYSELDFVSTPTLALGIEYPAMIAITDRIISPDSQNLEGVVAHEVAHQWFYNLVGNDQLDHPWLDESLAQFATLQYFSDQYGKAGYNGFRQSLEQRWQRVGSVPIPIDQPVASFTGQEYGAIVYGRGGLFFDELRVQMGAAVFDAFMRDYTAAFAWDIATTEGMKSIAEKHCDCDLTPIFQEWIYP